MRIAFLLVEEAAARECLGEISGSEVGGAAPALGAVGDPRVEVVLKNGRSLRVGPGFDRELVRALAAVLESPA